MDRFQHIVRFSIFGHTHSETFFLTNAIGSSKPIGANLVSPSGSPKTNKNPSFTVIDFDAEYMVPINIHTYYMDLEKANKNS